MGTMGRPREFDAEQALDKALDVFWRHGYEGTSISELTQAMGISPPSLYAAFGNKEKLFRSALDRYAEVRKQVWSELMSEPTARAMMERLFDRVHGLRFGRRRICDLVDYIVEDVDDIVFAH